MTRTLLTALLLSTAPTAALAQAGAGSGADEEDRGREGVTVEAHVLKPTGVEPTDERVAGLAVPEGFEVSVFARDLVNPRMIRVADDGTLYVTRRTVGDVLMLRDEDGDGRADRQEVVASRAQMHGIELDGDTMYLTTVSDVFRTTRNEDGTLGELETIVDDLPEGGQHPNRMVVKGPDGMLYVSVGSTCNACAETSPENATIVRMAPDGSERTVHASGLRNTIGYGFQPQTGELYGMDHGIDWLGDNEQHEEVNRIVEGAKYGWPYVYADGRYNPQDVPPNGLTFSEWADQSVEPIGLYTPHSAPMQLAFYEGDAFPEEYSGDAFVAMRGSWNRQPPSGYEVIRVDFEDGEPVAIEPFVTGFLLENEESPTGWSQMGRICGLAQGPDGALYLSDDTNGVIYKITYAGEDAAERPAPRMTNIGGAEPGLGDGIETMGAPEKTRELAMEVLGGDVPSLTVTSSAFEEGEAIPQTYAAEGGNVSPPLSWSGAPEETRAFALLAEDPDAPQDAPVIHWVAYDIPADVTELNEGLPGAPRLIMPEGVLQGANARGSTGWYGMRPPVGDRPHGYHFQVFALDAPLGLPHGASREAVLDAMEGHVLAAGELVGTYQRTEQASR